LAEQLAERARGGEDFAKLAEKYDNGDSSFRRGEGIGTKRGEIKPSEAENVLFQLKDGETAVVELEKGFHVVRLVKRDYAGQTPFDVKTQKQIKDKLTNEIGQVEIKRIVNTLKREAVIVYTKGEN
jgi:parvulin-like peptidyl-prolyl isomerase